MEQKASWYERTELLIGRESVAKLSQSRILLVGVGGVGAAAAEMLVRAGIGHLTIVDGDVVQLSNRNRQLNALNSTVGLKKIRVTAERLLDINPDLDLTLIPHFLEAEEMEPLLNSAAWDFVVDAIDTLAPKVALLETAHRKGMRLVSSMGAGAKMDLSKIQMADLSKTQQCALAKAVRSALGQRGIKKGIPVVFSMEPACKSAVISTSNEKHKKSTVGTISYLPVVFGCYLASYVIQELK